MVFSAQGNTIRDCELKRSSNQIWKSFSAWTALKELKIAIMMGAWNCMIKYTAGLDMMVGPTISQIAGSGMPRLKRNKVRQKQKATYVIKVKQDTCQTGSIFNIQSSERQDSSI